MFAIMISKKIYVAMNPFLFLVFGFLGDREHFWPFLRPVYEKNGDRDQ